MDVDFEMFAETNDNKFQEMSSLENKERLNVRNGKIVWKQGPHLAEF